MTELYTKCPKCKGAGTAPDCHPYDPPFDCPDCDNGHIPYKPAKDVEALAKAILTPYGCNSTMELEICIGMAAAKIAAFCEEREAFVCAELAEVNKLHEGFINAFDDLRTENNNLRGAMAADDERLLQAGQRVGLVWGCDNPEMMADEIETLRVKVERLRELVAAIVATKDVCWVLYNHIDKLTWSFDEQQADDINTHWRQYMEKHLSTITTAQAALKDGEVM